MLTYNTQKKRLVLPEYGRSIQEMVDHCLTIEDKDERTRCAYSIISCMGKLFPKLHEQDDYHQKLWDHLAIMSDFKLDIDYPCEVVRPENLQSSPAKVPYTNQYIRYRHYGKDVELMIAKAVAMAPGEERDELILLIANHMKKLLLAVNKDGVDDEKIFKDLAEYSHGEIKLSPETTTLRNFKLAPAPATSKKKRKR